jgi:hypothetical protein
MISLERLSSSLRKQGPIATEQFAYHRRLPASCLTMTGTAYGSLLSQGRQQTEVIKPARVIP